MIKIGKPENGWLELSFEYLNEVVSFDISDSGPDTIGQLLNLVTLLKKDAGAIEVECNLEPAVLKISCDVQSIQALIGLTLDNILVKELKYDTAKLAEALETQIQQFQSNEWGENWTH